MPYNYVNRADPDETIWIQAVWDSINILLPNIKQSIEAGQQLRKSEQNGFHDNFLISQPNPIRLPSLKSSLRDDSNEWSHHRVWLRNQKFSIFKTLNFGPYLLPCSGFACWVIFSDIFFFQKMQKIIVSSQIFCWYIIWMSNNLDLRWSPTFCGASSGSKLFA